MNNNELTEIMPGCVTLDVLANLLNITPRRIQQLAADGHIPKAATRGEYLLAGAIRGYINFLQKDGIVDEALLTEKLIEEINSLKLKNQKLKTANDRDDEILVEQADAREQMAYIAKTGLQVLETLPDILERDFALDTGIVTSVEEKINVLRDQWADLLEIDDEKP